MSERARERERERERDVSVCEYACMCMCMLCVCVCVWCPMCVSVVLGVFYCEYTPDLRLCARL